MVFSGCKGKIIGRGGGGDIAEELMVFSGGRRISRALDLHSIPAVSKFGD